MWRLVTPSSTMGAARRGPARRPRRRWPHCTALEDRCLLSVSLTENGPAVAYVGSPVSLTATSSGLGSNPVYQFSVGLQGGALHVVCDYSASNTFTWNPMQQGTYNIQVVVKDGFVGSTTESTSATYTAQTCVTGDSAVASPMANPLVALYSAPPSPGATMYVQFAEQGPTLSWQNTSSLPIVPGESTNFIVAGMLPNTTYLVRDVLDDGTVSVPVEFTTGSLPANLDFPTFTVVQAPAAGMDLGEGVIFHAGAFGNTIDTVATDLSGNIKGRRRWW
jgi:hypothetical protein